MICKECNHVNPDDSLFCQSCSAPMGDYNQGEDEENSVVQQETVIVEEKFPNKRQKILLLALIPLLLGLGMFLWAKKSAKEEARLSDQLRTQNKTTYSQSFQENPSGQDEKVLVTPSPNPAPVAPAPSQSATSNSQGQIKTQAPPQGPTTSGPAQSPATGQGSPSQTPNPQASTSPQADPSQELAQRLMGVWALDESPSTTGGGYRARLSPSRVEIYFRDSERLYDFSALQSSMGPRDNLLRLEGNLDVFGVDANYVNSLQPGTYDLIYADDANGYYNVRLYNNLIFVEYLSSSKIAIYLSGLEGTKETYTYLHAYDEGY